MTAPSQKPAPQKPAPRKPGPQKPRLQLKKGPKAAPKRGKKGKKKPPVEITPERLAAVPIFAALQPSMAHRLAPRVTHLDLDRGETLFEGPPADDKASPVFVVLHGDVSVSRGQGGASPVVVNYLQVGDAYVQKLFAEDPGDRLVLRALCPVKALRLSYPDVNYMLKKNPAFREDFSASIQRVTERQASRFSEPFQRDVGRFLVEQRLTFAGRVKLKRMDLCIECDGCYDACAERHGTDRLGSSEVRYGVTEVPANCHGCLVPECLDKCKFGMINIHEQTGEIVIDDNCTGCTLCARGCSFGAIRMHSLAELDLPRYFPDRQEKAKGKNIAQKCDNCTGYEDLACISACPSGAIFQIDGAALFDHWEQFTAHQSPGEAVAGPLRWWRWFWVALTVLNVLALSWECFGRLWWPQHTFGALLFNSPVDPTRPFRAGDWFSHTLGYAGGAMLLLTQAYRIGKAFAPRLGSLPIWMESHIWLGILGGVYGFFHTSFLFHGLVSVAAFVTMVVAIVTGIVGRYVLYLVPRSQAGTQLEAEQLQGQIDELDAEIDSLLAGAADHQMRARIATVIAGVDDLAALEDKRRRDRAQDARDAQGSKDPRATRLLQGLMELLGEDLEQRKRLERLARELEQGGVRAERAGELLGLLRAKGRLDRSLRRHALLSRILKRYRVVHVVASNVMFGALLLHIAVSLVFRVGN